MKIRRLLIVVLSIGVPLSVFSQEVDHSEGGCFTKTVEYSVVGQYIDGSDVYNYDNKSIIERVFFGETNSFVEFVMSHEQSLCISAFRIITDLQEDSCQLEIMTILHDQRWIDRERYIKAQISQIDIPPQMIHAIPLETRDLIKEHNKKAHEHLAGGEIFRTYHPEPQTFTISRTLAEMLHKKMSTLIADFNAEGVALFIVDGRSATFRCVVGDEVWTLKIHQPQKRAYQLSEVCWKMIQDGLQDMLDESKCLKLLEDIDL